MMEYLALKWLHILSSTLLFGTGLGSAYYKWLADRTGDIGHMARVNHHVVLADWWFTTPTVILQPVTGVAMAWLAGYSLAAPWLAGSILLYALAGLCWLPVVVIQIRMRDMCRQAMADEQPLPGLYRTYVRWWVRLGVVAFCSLVVVFYLMVFKP